MLTRTAVLIFALICCSASPLWGRPDPGNQQPTGIAASVDDTSPKDTSVSRTPDLGFPNKKVDIWNGYRRHLFLFGGKQAWIVEPPKPRGDGLFSWCLMFPDAFTKRCGTLELIEQGFFHVYLDVGNTFGAPTAVAELEAFHDMLIERGFATRAVLVGISRGGLYAHRYAAENPTKVSVIYGDAPVLDFKSWPAGFGVGKGSPNDWLTLKQLYDFKSDDEAIAYPGNPIDTLKTLAKQNIHLIYVAGDADDVVPWEENGKIAAARYDEIGGLVEVVLKSGIGHHPHGLDDPTPVVQFIVRHAAP